MSTKREDIQAIVAMMWAMALVATCIALVSRCVSNRAGGNVPSETVKRDTIVVRDTVARVNPEIRDSIVVRYVRVPVHVPVHDTLHYADSVSLPITQKVYGDSLYTAWVSGYEAALDSIHLYRTTTTITDTRTITVSL